MKSLKNTKTQKSLESRLMNTPTLQERVAEQRAKINVAHNNLEVYKSADLTPIPTPSQVEKKGFFNKLFAKPDTKTPAKPEPKQPQKTAKPLNADIVNRVKKDTMKEIEANILQGIQNEKYRQASERFNAIKNKEQRTPDIIDLAIEAGIIKDNNQSRSNVAYNIRKDTTGEYKKQLVQAIKDTGKTQLTPHMPVTLPDAHLQVNKLAERIYNRIKTGDIDRSLEIMEKYD